MLWLPVDVLLNLAGGAQTWLQWNNVCNLFLLFLRGCQLSRRSFSLQNQCGAGWISVRPTGIMWLHVVWSTCLFFIPSLAPSHSLSLCRSADVWTLWSGRREEEVNYSSGHQCCKEPFFLFILSFLSINICLSVLSSWTSPPRRRSGGSCPACWAVRYPPCYVYPWPAGPLVRWWHWRAPSTSRVARGILRSYHKLSLLVVCWFIPCDSYQITSGVEYLSIYPNSGLV